MAISLVVALSKYNGAKGQNHPVQTVQEEQMDDSDFTLNHIEALNKVNSKSSHPYLVDMMLDEKPIKMEIDTGACMSLISEVTFKQLFPGRTLKPSSARLSAYSGQPIPALGEMETVVTYNTQQATLPLIVVTGAGPSLLGRNWLSTIRLDWNSIATVSDQPALSKLLEKYDGVFKEGLGKLSGHEAKIHVDPDAQPRFCKARTLPYALRGKVEDELQRLEKEGIIQPVQFADWAAPIVPVIKADKKSLRICGDFKQTVNRASKLDKYPIPKIEDLFAKLAGGKTFSKLDMSQAYQQIPLEEESRKYVVINTHRGLFQYNRLPFGVSSAPGVFQRVMESLLNGIPHVVVYLDDILVTGPTEAEHLAALEEVLKRLQAAGLLLKREKCTFMAPSVIYLGHKIDAQGLHPIPEKVKAVQEAPKPNNVTELKSYLGLLSYYSKFLPNLSAVLAPLYKLLRQREPWQWKEPQDKAFTESKKLLLSSQVLVHFDPTLSIHLACDASDYGLGAVLSHVMPDGSEKPIGFVSRMLSDTEKKYSQIEREALACVVGVTRFHSYLWGHHFTLQTDHKPLLYLFKESKAIPQQAANRIQRWAWTLAAYEYTITWRNTNQHANADALSRLPLPEVPQKTTVPAELVLMVNELQDAPITAIQIAAWTRRDPLMARVLRYVLQGWPNRMEEDIKLYWPKRTELSTESGCLVWGGRVVVPPPGQDSVLAELHSGHPGISRMKSLARGLVWWPGLDKDIETVVQQCSSCQQNQPSPPAAPMQPWSWPTKPWSRVHVDYAGPIDGKMVLVVIDAHSKWIEAIPLKTATAFTTICQLKKLFAQFGLPHTLVSDNGPQFAAAEFQEYCQFNGIRHSRVAPYHPSSNGLAERAVRVVKDGLKKQQGDTLDDRLCGLLFQYRITPQTTTGTAPAQLLQGRNLRSRLDCLKPTVEERVYRKQQQQKKDHDKRSKVRQFIVGERVFVRNHSRNGDRWLSGIITSTSGPLSFKVDMENGRSVKCHRDHIHKRGKISTPTTFPTEDDFDLFLDFTIPATETQDAGPSVSLSAPTSTPENAAAPSNTIPPATSPPTSRPYPSRPRSQPNWFHAQYC